jgi:hypothetical protein
MSFLVEVDVLGDAGFTGWSGMVILGSMGLMGDCWATVKGVADSRTAASGVKV